MVSTRIAIAGCFNDMHSSFVQLSLGATPLNVNMNRFRSRVIESRLNGERYPLFSRLQYVLISIC